MTPGVLLAAAVAAGTLTADLPDDVLTSVASQKAAAPADVLAAVMKSVRPFAFDTAGIHVLTDRRWFQARSVEGSGAPALEIRRWPGDTILAFYALPAGVATLPPGLVPSGGATKSGACTVRDARLSSGKIERSAVWGDCAAGEGRVGVLGVPGDAGLGPQAKTDLREEILAVIARTRFEATGATASSALLLPELPAPPSAADERRDAWQVFQGDGFTIGLPPGFRAFRSDSGVPTPRGALPGGIAWLRGRFTDRDGNAIAVGDGRRAGYVARVEGDDEGWRAGVVPPRGAPGAERLDEAVLDETVLEWTGAQRAVVSHWREAGFAGDWLVFRLLLRGSGIEIGLPVVSGWRSLALFWIPVTWRGPGRPPAPPPIDPAVGLGVKFDRLGPAQKRQSLVEGTLHVGTLRLDIPRGYWPVANLGAPDGLPVTIYDPDGAVAGRIESVPAARIASILANDGWTPQPRPASRKAASIHVREDGTCVLAAREGEGYLLAPEAGAPERAEAWRRLVESASFVKAARRSAPGRTDE